MAIAERTLAAQFNRPGHEIVDHRTWAFVGDGCLMEGVSTGSHSLAGTLGLGKLKVVWDDNGISIDGKVANGSARTSTPATGLWLARRPRRRRPRPARPRCRHEGGRAITTKPV